MSISQYLAIGIMIFEAVASLIAFIVSQSVSRSRKKCVDRLNIESVIPTYTALANDIFGTKTGKQKKAFVLSELKSLCLENGVDFDPEEFSNLIDYYLSADSQSGIGGIYAKNESFTKARSSFFYEDGEKDQGDERQSRFVPRRN